MKPSTGTNDLRRAFLEFFQSKGHKVVASDSLVPQNDPSLLFTGAGMNQFKEYFLGIKKDLKRAATSQKCLRTGDLDEVGRTPFHHSFFEMLGNFSFGDYFKKEAIEWAWEFLTQKLQISRERLRVTVHEKDQEAFDIWRQVIGLPEDWIFRCGDKSNFWPANAPAMGPNGPCGPCSEIYYDQNPEISGTPVDDSGKYAEIWNLVFTQYDRREGGELVPLQNKNIDTGMGLERLACVLQGKGSNFEIDIFAPILDAICRCLSLNADQVPRKSLYCIADHLRAAVFSIADGVVPSNEGRGYVIRKLIRRAVWQGYELMDLKNRQQATKAFLHKAVPAIIQVMEAPYPELRDAAENIQTVLSQEEERFLKTLKDGLWILRNQIEDCKKQNAKQLSAPAVFELYDTYGFPEELTVRIAELEGLTTDREGFSRLMENQRNRSKEGSKISAEIFAKSDLEKIPSTVPATVFLGYDSLETTARILWFQAEGKAASLILDQTPFYAESGGQTGDQGILEGEGLRLRVRDTQKLDKYFIHHGEVLEGVLREGLAVKAFVDQDLRMAIMRNHTATHLLHAALRQHFGNSVRQLGSSVTAERFRFDYSFGRALTLEEIRKLEWRVNEQIWANRRVCKELQTLEKAKEAGALAFFGDKYGDKVRMVTIEGFSKELCGGTHCDMTGQIGCFLITAETSVASGVRRIEAVTGAASLKQVQGMQDQLGEVAGILKVGVADIAPRVSKLLEASKKQKLQGGVGSVSENTVQKMMELTTKIGSCAVLLHELEGLDINGLREVSDKLRILDQKLVYVIATSAGGKLHVIGGIAKALSKSSFDMKVLFGRLSGLLGISGGGRADFVQGGGSDPKLFRQARAQVEQAIADYIRDKGL